MGPISLLEITPGHGLRRGQAVRMAIPADQQAGLRRVHLGAVVDAQHGHVPGRLGLLASGGIGPLLQRQQTKSRDFKKPKADLSNMRKMPPGHAQDSFEVYEFPGQYTEFADGEHYAKVRVQELVSPHHRVYAQGNARMLTGSTGCTMALSNYPREDQNRQYLILAVSYHFTENVEVSDGGEGSTQRFAIQAQPTSRAFRPARLTPKPRTQGLQTAWVVGPPGEEIWTDKWGRVKVQFHWDRIGSMDDNSSCWMRVSSSWAGSNFGNIFIPRIGMEVLVDHIDANPDRPIITGCVYNTANMPPWDLPANATQSGFKTKSSKGGAAGAGIKDGPGDTNIIRFEDKTGGEQLWFHAQKDQLTEVEHDEDKWVGNDRRKTVDRDETNVIHRDRTETVDHDETITVHNNRSERVDHNETISIGDNRNETVGINESVTVGSNQTFTVGANRTKTVGRNEKDVIGKNWSVKVGVFKTETVGVGYMQNVGMGRVDTIGVLYNLNVGMIMATKVGKNKSTTVGTKYSLTVGSGGAGAPADGGGDLVESSGGEASSSGGGSSLNMDEDSITLKVGASTLTMKKDGTITLNGKDITITGTGEITANASSNFNAHGSTVNLTADGNVIVSGSQIHLN